MLGGMFAASLVRADANWIYYVFGDRRMMDKARAHWVDAFWQFSTALYGTAEVERACLELQDRDGLEVNLGLFCLFAAQHRVRFELPVIQAMRTVGIVWGCEVVAPLRAARRSMKAHVAGNETVGALREEVKRVELAAEQAMQAALIDLFVTIEARDDTETPAEIAAHNFAAWFDEEGIDGDAPRASVATLVHAAFG